MADRQKLQELMRLDAAEIGTSEENVKQKFLVPLLEALGHERKHLDFERPTQGRRIDVFIKGLKSDCKVIIDTKRYAEDLSQHLTQIGTYTTIEGALLTILVNGEELRIYSALRGISFDKSLLHSIQRKDLSSESTVLILDRFLGRSSLLNGEVHQHLEEREKELRESYTEIEELNEQYAESRESLSIELSEMEKHLLNIQSKIELKRQELSELEGKRYNRELLIWQRLGLIPPSEISQQITPKEIFVADGQMTQREQIDFSTMILETISELGGRGNVQEILTRIENKLKTRGQLTPYLLAPDPSGQIRWKHLVHGARMQLVNQKKLSNSSPRGIWEITTRVNR